MPPTTSRTTLRATRTRRRSISTASGSRGTELWGASAERGTALYIDMWEGYLDPIGATGMEGSDT